MSLLEKELSGIDISSCLRTIGYDAYYNGTCVDVLLTFIPFRNGCIDTARFLSLVKDQIITNFIITYKEIQKQYQRKDKLEADRYLYNKAIRKITRDTAKGKLGELLLYLLLEKYFNAPKIFSKISNLDDSHTHVKGADAVHAQYKDNDLFLYLGESKLWKRFGDASTSAVTSIMSTLQDYQGEFDLIETNIDFPNMTDKLAEEIISILNPYECMDKSPIIHTPCFIGFDSSICKDLYSEDEYQERYTRIAQNKIDTFYNKAIGNLDINKITLILLPFKSIDDFTDQFISILGIE
jgi:hypothetical protein